MGFGLHSTFMDSFLFYIPFKDKERPANKKFFPAKLREVLVTFGFLENLIVDSAKSLTPPGLGIHSSIF